MEIPPISDKYSTFDLFFLGFTSIDKLDFFYNKRYQLWVYQHSHEKEETVKDMEILFSLKFDKNGNITNADFSGTTRDGIPLSEKDFIKIELHNLEKVALSQLTFDEYKRVEFYKEFLNQKLESEAVEKEGPNLEQVSNPYPEVFKNLEAFLIFERLFHNNKDSVTTLADFSFIYRRMKKDGLLQNHQKPEVFREWLSNEPYEMTVDNKFKTLDNCTTRAKEEAYQATKQLVLIRTN